jgi:ATP synthase protein I
VAQPLPSEPSPLPEATDADDSGRPHIRLLEEPPERKVTGPRVRPGVRRRPALNETPMPPRGLGMTITSYLISGLLAYGLIGWLIGRAVHLPILTAAGMLIGLGISMALIIYRYGRSTPPRIRRFAPKPAPADAANEPNEQNGQMTTTRADDNDARGTDR